MEKSGVTPNEKGKASQKQHQVNVDLFLDQKGTVHKEFVPLTFLFPKLKMKLKGRRFQTVEDIQAELQAVLNTLGENDFQECFKNWQHRWDHCQESEGDYFEGDACP